MTSKHPLSPMPCRAVIPRRPRSRSGSAAIAGHSPLPAALLKFSGALMIAATLPYYGDALGALFSQVSESLSFILDR